MILYSPDTEQVTMTQLHQHSSLTDLPAYCFALSAPHEYVAVLVTYDCFRRRGDSDAYRVRPAVETTSLPAVEEEQPQDVGPALRHPAAAALPPQAVTLSPERSAFFFLGVAAATEIHVYFALPSQTLNKYFFL